MRIVHVIDTLDPATGGPAAVAGNMCAVLASKGCDVTLLRYGQADHVPEVVAKAAGWPLVRQVTLGAPRGIERILASRSKPILREQISGADCVHLHGVWSPLLVAAAAEARRRHIPYVVTPHGMFTEWSLHQKQLKKWISRVVRQDAMIRHARVVHLCSEFERSHSGLLRDLPNVLVRGIGIDLHEFQSMPPPDRELRRRAGAESNKLILFLGRVFPGKGIEYVIRALPLLKTAGTKLLVVGPENAPYADMLRRLALEEGVAERVTFAGAMNGPGRLVALATADLFVLMSDHENFSVAVAEAVAAGLGSVISDRVGISELLNEQVCSVVKRAPADIAAAIDEWLIDDARRNRARVLGPQLAEERLSWDAVVQWWIACYTDIAKDARKAT